MRVNTQISWPSIFSSATIPRSDRCSGGGWHRDVSTGQRRLVPAETEITRHEQQRPCGGCGGATEGLHVTGLSLEPLSLGLQNWLGLECHLDGEIYGIC